MSRGLHPTIVSEVRMPGASFQIVDYRWEAGAEILDYDPEIKLRWRIHPYRLKTRGWITPGKEENFGQLMLHPAGVPIYAQASDEHEQSRTLLCRFEQDWLATSIGGDRNLDIGRPTTCLDLRNSDIDHGMRRIMQELLRPGFASRAVIEGLGIAMAADVLRTFDRLGPDAEHGKGKLSPSRLRLIHDFIESFTEGCPSLSDVAAQCGVTAAHLRRLYKHTTGETLHSFIEEVRVRRARLLLKDTNLPLKVISHRLGFCHPSAFSFAFKKATGEAPREYRLRCGGLSLG